VGDVTWQDFEEVKATWLLSKAQLAELNSKRVSVQRAVAAAKPKDTGPTDYPEEEYETVRTSLAAVKTRWTGLVHL
jgi:hypothetical protein